MKTRARATNRRGRCARKLLRRIRVRNHAPTLLTSTIIPPPKLYRTFHSRQHSRGRAIWAAEITRTRRKCLIISSARSSSYYSSKTRSCQRACPLLPRYLGQHLPSLCNLSREQDRDAQSKRGRHPSLVQPPFDHLVNALGVPCRGVSSSSSAEAGPNNVRCTAASP